VQVVAPADVSMLLLLLQLKPGLGFYSELGRADQACKEAGKAVCVEVLLMA
jgi:hypothetical protein